MSGQWRPGGKSDHEVGGDTVADVLRGTLGVREACKAAGLAPEQRGAWARAFRRAALRSFDDGLRRALERQAWEDEGHAATEFCGPVTELPVVDLVQALALARRDGVIAIVDAGVESRLWCVAGEIVDAESGDLAGEAAVYRVLSLERGQVSAELCSVQRARRVERPTPALLLEAARRKDERELLRGRLAGLRFVSAASADRQTEPTRAALLSLLQTPLGIDELVPASGLGEYEALTTLVALLDGREVVCVAGDAASVLSRSAVPRRPASAPVRAGRHRLAAALAAGGVAALAALVLVTGHDASAPDAPATSTAASSAALAPRAAPASAPPDPLERPAHAPGPALAAPASSRSTPTVTTGALLPSPSQAVAPATLPAEPATATPARRRRAATSSRAPSTEPRPASSSPSVSERPAPRLPRMRIIEEHVPHMQIVE